MIKKQTVRWQPEQVKLQFSAMSVLTFDHFDVKYCSFRFMGCIIRLNLNSYMFNVF